MTFFKNEVKPLRLPSLSADAVRLFNAVSLRGLRYTLALAGTPCVLRISPVLPSEGGALSVKLLINGDPWVLTLGSAEIIRVHPLFKDPAVADLATADLPEELIEALTDVLLEPLLEKLSTILDVEVRFAGRIAIGEDSGNIPVAGGQLVWPDPKGAMAKTFFTFASVPGAAVDAADRLSRLDRQLKGAFCGVLESVPFICSVSGGEVSLGVSDLKDLAIGDVLIPETWWPDTQAARLTVSAGFGVRYVASLTLENQNATLAAPFERVTEKEMIDTDELEVRLTFELDRRTVTMGELKSLEPGYVFRLANEEASLVTVLANGRAIARGRLVDAGGIVGVQLTEKLTSGREEAGAAK